MRLGFGVGTVGTIVGTAWYYSQGLLLDLLSRTLELEQEQVVVA